MGEERTAQVPMTHTELQAGIELMDIAVRNGGLNVAAAALTIASKFKVSLEALNAPATTGDAGVPNDNKS